MIKDRWTRIRDASLRLALVFVLLAGLDIASLQHENEVITNKIQQQTTFLQHHRCKVLDNLVQDKSISFKTRIIYERLFPLFQCHNTPIHR